MSEDAGFDPRTVVTFFLLQGDFLDFFIYVLYSTLLHLSPSDSTVSEDAGVEPRTVATSILSVRRNSRWATSHPHSTQPSADEM